MFKRKPKTTQADNISFTVPEGVEYAQRLSSEEIRSRALQYAFYIKYPEGENVTLDDVIDQASRIERWIKAGR